MSGLPVLMPGLVLAVQVQPVHRPVTCPDSVRQRLQAARAAALERSRRDAATITGPAGK